MQRSIINSPELNGQIKKVWQLSVPAILTRITTIAMQYIDSAMVGALGANASASIGLVTTSTWLMGGIGVAVTTGFSVQVAHYTGASDNVGARRVVKHGLITSLVFALLLMAIGIGISTPLPRLLGGDEALWQDASRYFLLYSIFIPFSELNWLASAYLQCSGDMKTPSILNAMMCVLDVIFNAIYIPKYGVLGAAIGTGLATAVICIIMLWFCLVRSEALAITKREACPLDIFIMKRAAKIGTPVGLEEVAMCGAMVVSTAIIAPLGPVAIAAHSFAVTAEGLCYMPGYGIAAAATTLVGQSIGAGEHKNARRFANISTAFGCIVMGLTGLIMFVLCPLVFSFLTPVTEVQKLGVQVLRIGLLAEPLYGVSMVASGALRGAEDTLVPSLLNLLSIWFIRLSLAFLLVGSYGLHGMWIAMAAELCARGLLLLARMLRSGYLRKD